MRRLLDANFSNIKNYPVLHAGTVHLGGIGEFVGALKGAKETGIYTPGPADEDFFRQLAHAPHMDAAVRKAADEQRDRMLKQEQEAPVPALPAPTEEGRDE